MTTKSIPLSQQRELLRLQLQAQRILIVAQLDQKVAETHHAPNSMIMRFLTQQNGAKILAEVATVMLGTRWLQSTSARAIAKLATSVFSKK